LYDVASEKLKVIHLGITLNKQAPTPQTRKLSRTIRLLCPAYLIPVKGHAYLLEALRMVVDAGIDCRCVFAGEGRLRSALARKIRKLRLQNVVDMPGMIPHEALIQQLRSSAYDAVVLSSVEIGTEFEGIPVSLMEAMAAGLPCIATSTGAIGELIDGHCGILVNQRDPGALSEAIIALATDPVRRRELGDQAIQRIAEGFDASVSASFLGRLMTSMEPIKAASGCNGRKAEDSSAIVT